MSEGGPLKSLPCFLLEEEGLGGAPHLPFQGDLLRAPVVTLIPQLGFPPGNPVSFGYSPNERRRGDCKEENDDDNDDEETGAFQPSPGDPRSQI